MAEFSVTAAVGAGPGLIVRHPLAVLTWGLVSALVVVPILLLFGGAILNVVGQFMRAGDSATAQGYAVLSTVGALLLFMLVASLAGWVLTAVMTGAVFRAVLHPEQSAFAYLRLGAEEWSLMLVSLVLFLVFIGVGIALAIPTTVITLSAVGAPTPVRVAVTLLVSLARYAVTIWIWVRLCMATPMTFAERGFHLFESWAMTRGHTLPLFAVGILAFLILGAVEFVAALLSFSSLALVWKSVSAMQTNPQAAFANLQTVLAAFGPALVVWAVIYAVFAGIANAILRAPLAYIYRALNGPDVAATFS